MGFGLIIVGEKVKSGWGTDCGANNKSTCNKTSRNTDIKINDKIF